MSDPFPAAAEANPRVAVIGSGYWGKNLVRNHHKLGSLKLICERNETLLVQLKEQYPDVEFCLAFQDVLVRDDIKGVVVATQAETHFRLVQEALMAGKHVYVEKNGVAFKIIYSAIESLYDEYIDVVNDSINSFTIQ